MSAQPLLSICIPTYNRAHLLDNGIRIITQQIQDANAEDKIEFIISDNCSTDNTPEVVKKHIDNHKKILYIRNETNLGMDGNFVNCFKKASGRFIWLIGDDDYLVDGVLKAILNIIAQNDQIGLINLMQFSHSEDVISYTDSSQFFKDVNFGLTYISGNIVNSKFVSEIDFEKYMGTFFTIMPLYMTAAKKMPKNIIYYPVSLEGGKDFQRNGGYNFFAVFITNFLKIWKEYTKGEKHYYKNYNFVKYCIFRYHVMPFAWKLLFQKQNSNYSTDGAWSILIRHYGLMPYAWKYGLSSIFRKLGIVVRNRMSRYKSKH